MKTRIVQAIGDYLQMSDSRGLLRSLRLEPRRPMLARTLSSLKVLGAGIAIGRGLDRYGEDLVRYALARRRAQRTGFSKATVLAVGLGVGAAAALLLVPTLRATFGSNAKDRATPTAVKSDPVNGARPAARSASGDPVSVAT